MKQVSIGILDCEQCPYGKTSKVYTSDSFENVRKVHCSSLGKDVHSYLDWYEKATIPSICPLEDTKGGE